ncbi:MAG: ECF transporter S component [Clostridia bacterium]|nr:ECF transporter S component [Clostridia bacterium]
MNKKTNTKKNSTVMLAVSSVLAAIIVVMTFTPLGYLNIGFVEITFLTIPVAVGAIVCGPACGAFLGAVFGITSYMQCFGIGRPSPFGAALLSINPVATGIMCIVPRVLAGLLAALVFMAFKGKHKNISYALTSLSTGFFNTLFFVACLIGLFGTDKLSTLGLGDSIVKIIATLVTVNAVIEWAVCLVIGLAISKALDAVIKQKR